MRGFVLTVAVACLLLVVPASAPTQASAAPSFRFGIQDDAWLAFGAGTIQQRAATLQRLGVDVVRITLHWHRIEPARGEFDWTSDDELLQALRDHGLTPLVTIWGTPAWANGSRSPNWAPLQSDAMAEFARAAAERYGFVRYWLIWNEPNQRRWLRPVSASLYVSRILNPAYRSIKEVIPGARIGGGVTAPRGGTGGMSPIAFLQGIDRAGGRLDAYAHHPYPLRPAETPTSGGCGHCETVTMATLGRLLKEVGKAFPSARVWLTEYGYQTNPPDRVLGVSPAKQALYLAEASRRAAVLPRVDLLVHYLYRDEPALGRWQSGLTTVTGKPKPALAAAMLPLVQVSRKGSTIVVWGQVRPGSGAQRYVIQVRRGGAWAALGGARLTTPGGSLTATVPAARGAQLRLWYPARRLAGPAIVVR
jgi:Beta-galactosidase